MHRTPTPLHCIHIHSNGTKFTRQEWTECSLNVERLQLRFRHFYGRTNHFSVRKLRLFFVSSADCWLHSFIHSFEKLNWFLLRKSMWRDTEMKRVHARCIFSIFTHYDHFIFNEQLDTQTQSAIVYETALNRICRVGHTTMRTVVETRRLYKWKRLSARRRRRRSFESQPKNEILNAYRLHTHTHVRNESFLLRHTSHPTRFHSPIFAW